MNLYIVSTDDVLIESLKKTTLFNQVQSIQNLNELQDIKEKSTLIISDKLVQYGELTNFTFSHFDSVFYLMQHSISPSFEKTVKAICDSRDIVLVPPRLTESQIVEMIQQILNPQYEKKNNVFGFFSPISNSGTTSTCLSVANAIMKHSKAKIGVLLLNAWDCGTDQLKYKGTFLDEAKGKLSGKLIENEQEFLSLFHMVEKDSLYILGGNRNTKLERLYTKDEIHYLIEKSKESFDLVLIDCGSHFDNANMVQALNESNLKFMVMNQQMKAVKKFNRIYSDVLYPLGYERSDFLMIINDYEDKTIYPTTKQIHQEVNVPMLTAITKSSYGKVAELEEKSLYSYDDVGYQESIQLIAKSISSYANVELEFEQNKKKKRFSFLGV